jgi:hypothetical protein
MVLTLPLQYRGLFFVEGRCYPQVMNNNLWIMWTSLRTANENKLSACE